MERFSGKQYLLIDIATNFGLDKATWEERLQWAMNNLHTITDATQDELRKSFLPQAKEPAAVFAGILAYRDCLEHRQIGYTIGLDATASGLQLLATLMGCVKSGVLCNLVDSGRCRDAYSLVYDGCLADERFTNRTISRKQVKSAVMTHLYGSKAVPKEVFGEGLDLEIFYEVLNQLMPGANALNHALLGLWNPEALVHEWTLPDGFDVKVKVMGTEEHHFTFVDRPMTMISKVNKPQDSGLSLGANIIHSLDGMVVREMARRCSFREDRPSTVDRLLWNQDRTATSTMRKKDLELLRVLELSRDSGFYSAVLIDLIDEKNCGHLTQKDRYSVQALIASMPAIPFGILTIHDCFRCHPNNGNALRQQYRQILAEIGNGKMLTFIGQQLTPNCPPIALMDPDMPSFIRDSEYAIC